MHARLFDTLKGISNLSSTTVVNRNSLTNLAQGHDGIGKSKGICFNQLIVSWEMWLKFLIFEFFYGLLMITDIPYIPIENEVRWMPRDTIKPLI